MYGRILIPVDMAQTDKAPFMIEAAKCLSNGNGKYILANIVLSMPALAELSVPPEFFERANEEAEKKLSDIAKDAGIDANIVVRNGQPANELLAIAKEMNVEAIIVGSHRPGFQDYLLGSTAARVVRHAHCPVLVMR